MTQFWQNILNLYYSTCSWILFSNPFTGVLCQMEVASSSWKQRPVIRSPVHSPVLLQLPILLHSMTQAGMKVMKNKFNKLYWGCRLHSPSTTLATSTLMLVSTVLCVFRFPSCMDCANWNEASWKLGLLTIWLWSGHCIQFVLTSTAIIKNYIYGSYWYHVKKYIFKHISMLYFEWYFSYAYKNPAEVTKWRGE